MANKYDYWHWQNHFSLDVKKLNKFIEKNFDKFEESEKSAVDSTHKRQKNSTVKIIYYKKLKPLLHEVVDSCVECARQKFGYDVWYPRGNDGCNLNIYSSDNQGKYEWHVDAARTPHVEIKLTILINLSLKSYEGGQLHLWHGNEKCPTELDSPGNVFMFKSAITHKVTPVTKGERRTLTIFLLGPAWR